MGPGLYLKDAITALLILVVNFAILFVAIFIFAELIEPGHPPSFYEDAAPNIAGWTAPIGGGLLFLVVTFFRTKRNPSRGVFGAVFTTWVFYVLFDIGLGALMAAGNPVVTLQLFGSLGLALLGGILGAWFATRPQ